MKTPEQLAEDYSEAIDLCCGTSDIIIQAEGAFMAGYEAGQKALHARIDNLEKNWSFCCRDKLNLVKENSKYMREIDSLQKLVRECQHKWEREIDERPKEDK